MKRKRIFSYIITLVISLLMMTTLNAATAYIKVTPNQKVTVGNTFTVKVNITSSSALGSYDYLLSYDKNKVKLVSGSTHNIDQVGSSNSKSFKTKSFTFKAIDSGSSKISVKSALVYSYAESTMSLSITPATINALSKAEIEASYSKNNYLSYLSVEGATLSPAFNKDTTKYTVSLGANTETIKVNAKKADSNASLSGGGNVKVYEGENKIEITVKAENGSTKTYTIVATVTDPNPINVKDTAGNDLTIVKRESLLTNPETFTSKVITIDGQEVPAFYSEITKFTLVGLKDSEGSINLYLYDEIKNTYTIFKEFKSNLTTLFILENEKENIGEYKKTTIEINNNTFSAYKINNKSEFAVIYAIDIEDGKKEFYLLDQIQNSVIRYNDEVSPIYNEKIDSYKFIIYILCGETGLLFVIVIGMLIKKSSRNKRRKDNFINNKENKKEKKDYDKKQLKEKIKEEKKKKKEEKQQKKKDKNKKQEEKIEENETL